MNLVREIMPNGMPVIIEALLDDDGEVELDSIRMFPLFPEPGDIFAGGDPELRVDKPVSKERIGGRASLNLFIRLTKLLREDYEHETS
jgi:hypothetical protein|tara:strand:+ start:282 stop:545 length:264 start_codon:yes stop_codon:yes gene_type:complete